MKQEIFPGVGSAKIITSWEERKVKVRIFHMWKYIYKEAWMDWHVHGYVLKGDMIISIPELGGEYCDRFVIERPKTGDIIIERRIVNTKSRLYFYEIVKHKWHPRYMPVEGMFSGTVAFTHYQDYNIEEEIPSEILF